jgi:CRP/FNR family transcriptional regulator, cyclic AMP receptor protein
VLPVVGPLDVNVRENPSASHVAERAPSRGRVYDPAVTAASDRINLFRHAPDTEEHPGGAILFAEGDAGDVMFAVKSGEVELLVGDRVVEVVGEGSVLGEMALIDKLPRSATARVKQRCELVRIDEKRFAFLVQQTPLFALEIMRVITRRLRAANQA